MSPVFVGKFCQEMEERGEAVLHDVAAAFNLAEELRIFRSTFYTGLYCGRVSTSLSRSVIRFYDTKHQTKCLY